VVVPPAVAVLVKPIKLAIAYGAVFAPVPPLVIGKAVAMERFETLTLPEKLVTAFPDTVSVLDIVTVFAVKELEWFTASVIFVASLNTIIDLPAGTVTVVPVTAPFDPFETITELLSPLLIMYCLLIAGTNKYCGAVADPVIVNLALRAV
jgi:hypothetical protein